MSDLWRLSAVELAARIRRRDVSAVQAAQSAGSPAGGESPDQRRGRSPARGCVGAGCPGGPGPGARRRPRRARGRAGDGQGQCGPGRLCHHQRRDVAEGRDRDGQQPGGGQPAQGGCGDHRPHQHPRVFIAMVHRQPAARQYLEPAQSRADAGRLVRRRRGGGGGGHWPSGAWHRYRGLDPLPRLCLRRARPASVAGPCARLQRSPARTHHRRPDHGGVRSAGSQHRRPAAGPGRDGRGRSARSVVGAGAIDRSDRCGARRFA